MSEKHEWQARLHEATDTRTVLRAVMRAVQLIPDGTPECVATSFTPRDLESREDVEHWGRRLGLAGAPQGSRHAAMRTLFAAALQRLNDIGPRRRCTGLFEAQGLSPAAS